jgi:hypothetical protein
MNRKGAVKKAQALKEAAPCEVSARAAPPASAWTDPATRRKVRELTGIRGASTIQRAREAVRARCGAVAKGIDLKHGSQ